MTLEKQLEECRILWSKAKGEGDTLTMGNVRRRAEFIKKLLGARERWTERLGKLKEAYQKEKTEADDLFEAAKKIFTVDQTSGLNTSASHSIPS